MKTVWNVIYWDDDTEPSMLTFDNEYAANECFNEKRIKYPNGCYVEEVDVFEQWNKKPCGFCQGEYYYDKYTGSYIDIINNTRLEFDNSVGEYESGRMPINFCPVCGRKL